MLEIRNLSKIYRSKTGEEVRALDDVSISFPESGMVFILGKSGSGKSTLLNIMGGLDSYDSGEFVIKGKSSKDFGGSDFDAYRNTFIGFIFQEYNVLDDFTVGANIALALELQGKKATSDKIGEILERVDLTTYAKRKPNELSGGQKQRVAIARALVKDPQIIMADEPTGALDSNTGKQIFDTLKKLSREKLVLVVSHDRDFAERYADRIVELSDGKIISDVTKHEHESEKISDGIDKINSHILRIKRGYRLTANDMQMINDYLAANEGDVILSGDTRVNEELRSAAGISESGATSVFEATDGEKDYSIKKYEKKDSHFIRSRLPMKNAVRMGSSGLKHKKFRLVMTVLLSMIAFAMFGFADTMAAYNKVKASVDSVLDSNVKNASVTVGVRRTVTHGDGDTYTSYDSAALNDEDLAYLIEQTGLEFVPVFNGTAGETYGNSGFSVTGMMQNYESNTVYSGKLHGLVHLSTEQLATVGFPISGSLPEKEGQIAITELMYRQLNQYGFQNKQFNESVAAGSLVKEPGSANSIIGKHLTLSGGFFSMDGSTNSFEIVGVVDTGFDYNRYQAFLPQETDSNRPSIPQDGNMLTDMVLAMEIESELNYGFHGLGFTTNEDIVKLSKLAGNLQRPLGQYMHGNKSNLYISLTALESEDDKKVEELGFRISEVAGSSALSSLTIEWFDGTERTTLAANEIVLPSYWLDRINSGEIELTFKPEDIRAWVSTQYGAEHWDATNAEKSYGDRIREAAIRSYIDEKLQDTDVLEALKSYAFSYGATVTNLDEAREFWIERWLNTGEGQAPVNNAEELNVQSFWDIQTKTEEVIRAYIADTVLTLGLPSGTPTRYLDRLLNLLNSATEQEPTVIVQPYEITDVVRYAYAYDDIVKKDLLNNDDLISKMLESDYTSFKNLDEWNTLDPESQRSILLNYYIDMYLIHSDGGYNSNAYGGRTGKEIDDLAQKAIRDIKQTDGDDPFAGFTFALMEQSYELDHSSTVKEYDFKVVGVYDSSLYRYSEILVSDTVLADYQAWAETQMDGYSYKEEIAPHAAGIWGFALAPLDGNRVAMEKLAELSYDETGDLQFVMQNPVMDTLETFNDFIETGAQVFLYVGIAFAVFSALLLMNFIATSISYKKREIGVLRAVGARSSDVFKIFFSEALIIAIINFIFATAAVIIAIIFTNNWMHNSGINITLLSYGVRQFFLMLLISVCVALLASFLPVYGIARKKPVDAIKDR